MGEIRREEGTFPSKDNLKLFWTSTVPADAKAHVAIIHGYAEHIGRYAHVFDYLAAEGFAVHGLDCRGHGRSEGRRGHCNRFTDFLDDLALFLEKVKVYAGGRKIFLLGHSHGALICARYGLLEPTGINGMVFTSPWFRPGFLPSPVKIALGKAVGLVIPWLPIPNEIASDKLTRDAAMVAAHRVDPLVNATATPGWFNQAIAAQKDLLERAQAFTLPFDMLVGGADPIADKSGAREFFEKAGSKDKAYLDYPGALHEVLNEINRAEVLAEITAWLNARSSP